MKKLFAGFVLLVAVNLARADVNYYIAKEQAKRSTGQDVGASGGTGGAPTAPAMDPALVATLRKISSLANDIIALNQSTAPKPDPDVKVALLNDLMSAAQGTKPPAALVQKLGGQLATALNGRKLPVAAQKKLASGLLAVFNGAHLAAAQLETTLDGIKKILTDADVTAEDVDNVLASLKTIATATQ